jgi:hypothetical protein
MNGARLARPVGFLQRFIAPALHDIAGAALMSFMRGSFVVAILLLWAGAADAASIGCPPAGYDRARLETLNSRHWEIADAGERESLARAMVACLADPDTHYRDELAFNAFQHWMRAGELGDDAVLAIGDELQAWLSAPAGEGFRRPFAALILAEVARTDRVHPWMTPARRRSLLDAAIAYLSTVRDYRGFEDGGAGWRHGVAHGADLMLQLALNPAFGKPELVRIRAAIASQIAPPGHFYIYGEAARLAAAIVIMAQRKLFSEAEWTAWIAAAASPAPLASWDDAFSRQVDIARVRDVHDFIAALYIDAKLDANADDDVLLPGAEAALHILP